MKGNRQEVFDYIFSKADEVGYMGLDSAKSGAFQDELGKDSELKRIAGEQLSRNYIKDTVLNNYSKKQRYISKSDVLSVFIEFDDIDVLGSKKDLENGLFKVVYDGTEFESTSASINEWQTVLKRFGKKAESGVRFAFLTCGGVTKSQEELDSACEILASYNVTALIVKPSQKPISIKLYTERKSKIKTLSLTNLSKPFLLLAGISGTGKTRFVREQARLSGSIEDTYCLTSVRPDWHEPSDLLGYVSRLSGNPEYIVTDVLKFIVKAWIEVVQAGVLLQGNKTTGKQSQQQQVQPFWLCLDEMNLAPVEQYFADYLSVLETREWDWHEGGFTYKCDPILKSAVFDSVDKVKLQHELGLEGHEELWKHFVANGIGVPFNLIVAGTVNMDETTHGFSRKVIDRALTFDFGEFFPNDFDAFFDAKSEPKALSYPVLTDGRNKSELSGTFDKDGALSISFLKKTNVILENTPFKLAYRALNELLLAVITQKPQNELELQSVWDDFLMCKVLPRIEGDIDKLTKGDSEPSILEQLNALFSEQLAAIWLTSTRKDMFRNSLEDPSSINIECRSRIKLDWMISQLKNGFTSFWP
ncbi:McrB family protein [Vibrio harveyi]